MSSKPSHQILLYYRYTSIADPELFCQQQRALCEELSLRGRILIAAEGLNGTVSGTIEQTESYMQACHALPGFEEMPFKVDPADGHAFPKLSIKVRSEVVTLGLGNEDIDPNSVTGERLEPDQWQEMLKSAGDDVVVLDGRNRYESELGHFRGAVCPDIENFRDFPEWFDAHRKEFEGKQVMTYCTGGIRCEKLSGFLKKEGIDDVFQLEGGIVRYGHSEEAAGDLFDGRCYVFDERIVVDINRTDSNNIVSRCEACGEASDRYVNCALQACNRQHFRCEKCESQVGRVCSPECQQVVDAAAS